MITQEFEGQFIEYGNNDTMDGVTITFDVKDSIFNSLSDFDWRILAHRPNKFKIIVEFNEKEIHEAIK